jgi:hypothetical protein
MADRTPIQMLQELVPTEPGRGDPAATAARRDAVRALADRAIDVGGSGQGGAGSARAAKAVDAARRLADGVLDL